jgi:ABC-type transporter Mla subunit MlaD
MGEEKKNSKNLPLTYLKTSINRLIDEYEQNHALLNDQIQAVINHDILSLNRLIEKQVEAYETLKGSEKKFREQLKAFQYRSDSSSSRSLQGVLKAIGKPSQTLNDLRNRLHMQVEKTEKLRAQLIDLLEFAQQQNDEIFKAIRKIEGEKAEGYDAEGKKQHQLGSLAINQKA